MSSLDNRTPPASPAQTDAEDAFDAEMVRRQYDEGEDGDLDALESALTRTSSLARPRSPSSRLTAILCEMDKLKCDMLVAMYCAVIGAENERVPQLAAMAQAAHDKEDERGLLLCLRLQRV